MVSKNDFIECNYPDYYNCDDIAMINDLSVLINKEQLIGSSADILLNDCYNSDIENKQIKIDCEYLEKKVFQKAILAYEEK